MVISLAVMMFMALSTVNASASTFPNTFCNPINIEYNWWNTSESFQAAADPEIRIFKGEYYLFASQSAGYWWSSDMVNWNFVKPTGLNVVKYAPSVLVIGIPCIIPLRKMEIYTRPMIPRVSMDHSENKYRFSGSISIS